MADLRQRSHLGDAAVSQCRLIRDRLGPTAADRHLMEDATMQKKTPLSSLMTELAVAMALAAETTPADGTGGQEDIV